MDKISKHAQKSIKLNMTGWGRWSVRNCARKWDSTENNEQRNDEQMVHTQTRIRSGEYDIKFPRNLRYK